MNVWAVSSFWYYEQTCYKHVLWCTYDSFLWSQTQKQKSSENTFLFSFRRTCQMALKCLCHISFLPAVYWSSSSLEHSTASPTIFFVFLLKFQSFWWIWSGFNVYFPETWWCWVSFLCYGLSGYYFFKNEVLVKCFGSFFFSPLTCSST